MANTHILPSSYINITAAESSKTEFIPYSDILTAVNCRDKITFLKLMWTASANTALYSQRLESLENTRQSLKRRIDSFSLALSEVEKTRTKDMTDEQFAQRIQMCKEIHEMLKKTLFELDIINQNIVYLNVYNEDRQSKFRQKMSSYHQQIEVLIEKKIDFIMDCLKQHNTLTDKPDAEIREALKKTLHAPDLQEAYIKAAGQERMGFAEKLKGWFRS
jgi:DNA repair ATPase RecN